MYEISKIDELISPDLSVQYQQTRCNIGCVWRNLLILHVQCQLAALGEEKIKLVISVKISPKSLQKNCQAH